MRYTVRLAGPRLFAAAVAAMLVVPAAAQDAQRQVRLSLQADKRAVRIEDALEAFESVSYQVALHAGQTLQVTLASNNLAHVFDIHVPEASKPVFVGADSGNSTQLRAKVTGEYVIRTYLLRFAARDGQSASYTLEARIAP